VSEGKVQSKKIKQLEAEGYYVIKLMKTNKNGIPDLIALKPNETPYFIEVKTATGKLSKLQEYRLGELKSLGFKTEVHYG
jgi:Holliday junction resolvase